MKKILWLTFIFTLLFTSYSFAAYTFKPSTAGTTINATLSGVPESNTNTFRLAILTAPFPATPSATFRDSADTFSQASTDKKAYKGTVTWQLADYSNITIGVTYYARVIEITADNKLSYTTDTVPIIAGGGSAPAANGYKLEAKPKGTTITATLSGIPNNHLYKLVAQTTPFEGNAYTGKISGENEIPLDPSLKKASLGKNKTTSLTWTLGGLKANTVYYLRVVDLTTTSSVSIPQYITPQSAVITKNASIPLLSLETEKSGNDVIVKGQLDVSKIPNFNPGSYRAELYYTRTAPLSESGPLTDGTSLNSMRVQNYGDPCTDGLRSTTVCDGINADGTYYWRLTSLAPSTTYYIQQTVYESNRNPIKDGIANFNSDTGNIVNAGEQDAYDKERSYTFLSDNTGATVLPDPDLCAEQRLAGLDPKLCDMNDIINYGIKIVIGLAGIAFVFRLMYEGYAYMTSDTPFRVASAKGAMFTALWGLLLALTSYIILNTINPRLVKNDVAVTQLSIAIDEDRDGDNPVITQPSGTLPVGKVAKCDAGIGSYKTPGGTFWACNTIGPNLTKMITAARAAGINISGGGFRTNTEQIKLRRDHCGAAYVYTVGAKCKPPTAVPGYSRHESGLAFDLTCDGQTIRSKDNKCFVWLQKNAGSYGLRNFPAEPWHWSIDGR